MLTPFCPICATAIEGELDVLTAVATGGGHYGHFWCVYPSGPKERIVVSLPDFEQIEYWCDELGDNRIWHFTI